MQAEAAINFRMNLVKNILTNNSEFISNKNINKSSVVVFCGLQRNNNKKKSNS